MPLDQFFFVLLDPVYVLSTALKGQPKERGRERELMRERDSMLRFIEINKKTT